MESILSEMFLSSIHPVRNCLNSFRQMFKRVDILLNQGQKTGGLAVLQDKDRFIYYLVTKQNSSGKPTLRTLFASLLKMRQHIEQNKVKKLAMPRIGCGLDRLEWSEVKPMLEYIFQDVDVKIVVCNFQQVRCFLFDFIWKFIHGSAFCCRITAKLNKNYNKNPSLRIKI